MELKHIQLKELNDFVESFDCDKGSVIPITALRAFSQQLNPNALPEQVVLTIAYDAKTLLGFIGALPTNINGVQCAWNSGWWVTKGAPAEVSMKLLFSFISNWDKKILFSEMTPHTSLIIEKLGFCTHYTTKGLRGYYRFTTNEVLPQKKPILGKIKWMLRIFDFILNIFVNIKSDFAKSPKNDFSVKITSNLFDKDDEFIEKYNQNQPDKRYSNCFNWIAEDRWITTTKTKKNTCNYPFSLYVKRYDSKWIRFYKNGEQLALVNYTLRNNQLKLQYVYCQKSFTNELANYFYNFLKKDKSLATITTFHQGLADFLKEKSFIYKTELPKMSAISNELMKQIDIEMPSFQMGDGDCVFT